ncbi:hypothetical protein BU23DRAFT_572555 [Bimuria novae-zelandiae CBS 107.79]|uniref:Uncharacterized protein n=1 Tax=Bimuria novae-zelandiae CBS 107.79 TaxID=1447943 RepID=A0A6A5UU14_9PLEO|nr:hypothetical protein BU23DRAFT_572555 [Bimuria novae-zelandiae CBS 107.79]
MADEAVSTSASLSLTEQSLPTPTPSSISSEAVSETSETTHSTTASTSTTSDAAPDSTASPAAVASTQSNSHTAAIAGGSAGGGVVIALLVCWLIYNICYVKRSRQKHNDQLERRQSDLAVATMIDNSSKAATPYNPDGAPPGYSSPGPNSYPYGPSTYGYRHHTGSPTAGWKPHHRPRPSELSGETAVRSELESPSSSPDIGNLPQSQPGNPSPHSQQTMLGDGSTWTRFSHQGGMGNAQPMAFPTTPLLGIHVEGGNELNQDEWRPR